jgi:hypothetical protein
MRTYYVIVYGYIISDVYLKGLGGVIDIIARIDVKLILFNIRNIV